MNNIIYFAVNILLLLNMAKIYSFSWANDQVRLICYVVIAMCLIVAFIINVIRSRGIVRIDKTAVSLLLFMIVIALNLFLRGVTDDGEWLYRLMVPVTYLGVLACYRRSFDFERIVDVELVIAFITVIIYIFSRFTVRQAGAGVLNSVFYCVLMLPFVFSSNNTKKVDVLFVLIAFASLISLKRTAIIIVLVTAILYYRKRDKESRDAVNKAILGLLIFAFVLWFVQLKLGIDVLGKIVNTIDDGGSGRQNIYGTLLHNIFNRSFDEIVFGGGLEALIKIVGGSSHNDYLEVLFQFGIVGFIAFAMILISLIREAIKMKINGYRLYDQFCMSIVCFVVMTMLSQIINLPTYFLSIVLFWGIVINDYYNYIYFGHCQSEENYHLD